jgi:8-oxo-dGTP pyrophosphatase MutT (NUDIX family)
MAMRLVSKVVCYVVCGSKLLVFRQPNNPEAGLQVPAGTIEAGESPEDAARREVVEETGLSDLRSLGKLGSYRFDMSQWKPEIHERHVFAFETTKPAPAQWAQLETNGRGGSDAGIEFTFSWCDLRREEPSLIADQGRFLPELRALRGM